MILSKQTEAHVLKDGESKGSIGMSLDLDSAQVLMQMLSKNLYSDAIGSTIRECASNALDSHRRSGTDRPIVVGFGPVSGMNYEFSVEDFGTGLDAHDVENIISKYGKSTKRNSDTELGMMGLGFKAPLAYSSSFTFVCRKDGKERKYMMYEGEDVNSIDLLFEGTTKEPNGVKVIIPVKYNDTREFVKKIKEQLAYFESVYFNVPEIGNDFSIFRGDLFQFSEISRDPLLHICLDNVYYPLDFAKLGIPSIDIPVGLRFSLKDGLFPTPNRESLRYTQESKKIILDKIAELSNYIVGKYNETIVDAEDIQAIIAYYTSDIKKFNITPTSSIVINKLLPYAKTRLKDPQLKGIKLLNLERVVKQRSYILGEWQSKFSLSRGIMKDDTKTYGKGSISLNYVDNIHFYEYEGVIGGNMKAYLKSILPSSETFYFVKKAKPYILGSKTEKDLHSYYHILNLGVHKKNEWRARIEEFNYIQSLFTSKFKDLDKVVIPQTWLDARKKAKPMAIGKKLKMKGEIIGKMAVPLERFVSGQACKFVSKIWKLEAIESNRFLTVYDSHDNKDNLDELYELSEKQNITFMTFSQRELNILKDVEIHNLIPYDKFMKGETKPFKRIISAYLIQNLINSHSDTFGKKNFFKNISTAFQDKLTTLANYADKNHQKHGSKDMYEAMLLIANKHNYFDLEIMAVYDDVKHTLERLPFIEHMMDNIYSQEHDLIPCLVDLLKYHKFKVNLDQYKAKEIVPEETEVEVVVEKEEEEIVTN